MAEEIEMSEVIAQAVAEAIRIMIQTMAEMQSRMGDKPTRAQDRWPSAEAATVQLGGDRQIFRVESHSF